MQKKDITKKYILISSYVTISVLYQAAILDFCEQITNEVLKLEKKTWNEFPVKNLVKKRYYQGIYVKFFVCYNLKKWLNFWNCSSFPIAAILIVQWQRLYNVKIGLEVSFSRTFMQKKDNTKEYIWISSFSVLYQAAILNFCIQNTNEALKLKKKT